MDFQTVNLMLGKSFLLNCQIFIVTLLLALSKRIVRMDRLTREGQFTQRNTYKTTELKNATVGIIGMGKISRLVVKKLSGFEMRIIASDPFVKQEDVGELPVTMVSSEEVYRTADFVIVHTSLFPSTFHLVGAEQFQMMKPTAYIINAARRRRATGIKNTSRPRFFHGSPKLWPGPISQI